MMAEWADLAKVPAQTKRLAQYALFVPLAIFSPLAAGPDFFALGLLLGAAFFIVIVTRRPILGWGTLYCGLPVFALLLIRDRSEEHTSELQSLMRISYAVFCLKKKKIKHKQHCNAIHLIQHITHKQLLNQSS